MKRNHETIDNAPHALRSNDLTTETSVKCIPETMLVMLDAVPRLAALLTSYRIAVADGYPDMVQLVGCALSDAAVCGSTLPDAGFSAPQIWQFVKIHVRG